ncbi:Aste57867_2156 [Aphanomyces stellatus]|uniref:Aste57867_1925 protein n=1 Tax=Aphanomyces stellatus TaxID=120398 RepID=A0A485K6Z2_9STRA|nr:hypothetical protein As57867_002151 [Aphanomyces stellatus]KAF0718047.1 hypothetical protein As57867_001923 [Aphanomyces stellatus]KAF0718061.1 hypothetical protein As57867_001937 [Aphanomyces stellatus]VFT79130.1 Aste57867_1925 [Aphanomyces stellatus]VFT79144.1 Aste57867_1939 [Aphanomyces stellatus]
MWVARGPPRILKRDPHALVFLCSQGHWKAEMTPTSLTLRCLQYKEDPFPPQRVPRQGAPPLAAAFLPSATASRLAVLTATTLEMYNYSVDATDGVRLLALESITIGVLGSEEGRCLAVNEDNLFLGTSKGRVMIFRWAFMGSGGHVISPLEHLNLSSFSDDVQSLSISCNTSFLLTTRVVVAVSLSNGLCALMCFAPDTFHLEDIFMIPHVDKCTVCELDSDASLLAVGTHESTVLLFRLQWTTKIELHSKRFQSVSVDKTASSLSLQLWGYQAEDLGPVAALAFTQDNRTVAIGYAHRGVSVFSTDGCKLMTTLPQQVGSSYKDEVARHGVQRLQWSHASGTLVVTPSSAPPPSGAAPPKPLFQELSLQLLKDADGLCLSLAGEPNQLGAWVRTEQPFAKRPSDGTPGPAELSNKLHGGELLLSINGRSVWQSSFESIVSQIKELPVGAPVTLSFLVISFSLVFPLATEALMDPAFREIHQLKWDEEDHTIWEYGLRMQALHGDCNVDTPSLMDVDARAKFDAWAALQNCSHLLALHRYAKLYLSLFPEWHPQHALQMLQPPPPPSSSSLNNATTTLVLVDFARSVLPLGRSDLHLLESQAVHLVATRSVNDPCGVLSSVSISVPSNYAHANQPMQLLAVNPSDTRLAVAGTRGFALYNKRTAKWHLFGSELEEQSFQVVAMEWWKDELVVALTREGTQLYLDVFPRNHLDLDARLAHISMPADCHAITLDDHAVYCLCDTKLMVYRITSAGTLDNNSFTFALTFFRAESLPLCNAFLGRARCFSVIPRLQRQATDQDQGNSWFGGWSLWGEATPPEWTMPRFLVLDQVNCAYMWDPETKIQTLIASEITYISHWQAPTEWPVMCSHMVGLYGRQGYQVWWPLMDNIVFGSPVDKSSVVQFLQAHDPFRVKSVASGLSKGLAWEEYLGLLAEYGVHLQHGVTFSASAMLQDPLLRFNPEVQILGIHPWFGVLVGGFQDNYLGIYDLACRAQPFLHTTICYLLLQGQIDIAKTIMHSMRQRCALTTLTQELVLVAILDKCFQSKWDVGILEHALSLLKDAHGEMETYCEIVANVARKVEPNRLPHLFPLAGDPAQLLQLCRQRNEIRTAANFLLCLDESVANEPTLERPRTNSFAQFQSRSALAFELLVDCCEKDQLHLALQVVRVARAWEPEHYRSSSQQYDRYIDEQVGKYAFQMLVQHRFDKVVWLLTQVEAQLPTLYGEELGVHEKNTAMIQTRLMALLTDAQMRTLHMAVVAAKYEQWATLIKNLLDQPARRIQ